MPLVEEYLFLFFFFPLKEVLIPFFLIIQNDNLYFYSLRYVFSLIFFFGDLTLLDDTILNLLLPIT